MHDNPQLRQAQKVWLTALDPDAHWTARALSCAMTLVLVGYLPVLCVMMGCRSGAFLQQVSDIALERRILVVGTGVFWMLGFCLLAGGYHPLLFRDRTLPQLLTMPLGPHGLLVRKLRPVGFVAAVGFALTAMLYVSFALEYGEGDLRLVVPALGIAAIQGAMNLCVPLVIALFAFRTYTKLASGLFLVANLVAMPAAFLAKQDPTRYVAAVEAWFRTTNLIAVVDAFPGAWSAHLFHGACIAREGWLPWALASLVCCLACAALVWWSLPRTYSTDRALAELESPPVFVSRRRWERQRREESLGASPLDRLYERLFDRRQRSAIALALRHDFTGGIGAPMRRVMGIGGLAWLAVASLWLPPGSLGMSAPTHEGVVFLVCPCLALAAVGCWTASMYRHFGRGQWQRGWGQTPYHELMPWTPREQIACLVRFASFACGCTWAAFLPAILTARAAVADRLAFALAALMGPIGVATLFALLQWIGPMRHPARSPRGALTTVWYWFLGLLIGLAVLIIGGPIMDMACDSMGDSAVLLSLACVPVVDAALLYVVWRFLVARHNYDVETDGFR